jgi:RsmE family RNA methyltransferase
VAAGDRDRFGWLVEKSAELGVTHLLPLETERTRGVGTRVRPTHIGKLQRRAFEAIKQSGAAWAPTVSEPMELETFINRERDGVRWLADADGQAPPSVATSEPAWTAVGPEGGFTRRGDARVPAGRLVAGEARCAHP